METSSDNIVILGPENEVLAEYPSGQIEEAYGCCLEFEEMGIEVKMRIPSLPEELARALGGTTADCQKIRTELLEEISHHID